MKIWKKWENVYFGLNGLLAVTVIFDFTQASLTILLLKHFFIILVLHVTILFITGQTLHLCITSECQAKRGKERSLSPEQELDLDNIWTICSYLTLFLPPLIVES